MDMKTQKIKKNNLQQLKYLSYNLFNNYNLAKMRRNKMKKTKIVIVPIIISLLLVTMSMLLSGCSLINETTYFGIPTGYYDLVEGNATHKDYKLYVGQTLIGNEIKYNVHYDVSQDENGFIYMLHDVGYHVYSHKVIY